MGLFTRKLTIEYIQEHLRTKGIWATRDGEILYFKTMGINMRLFYDGRLYIESKWNHLLDDPTAMVHMINRANGESLFVKGWLYRDEEAQEHAEKAWVSRWSSEMICSSREDFRIIFPLVCQQIVEVAGQAHQWYNEFMESAAKLMAPTAKIGFVQEPVEAVTPEPGEPGEPGKQGESTPAEGDPVATACSKSEKSPRRKIGF